MMHLKFLLCFLTTITSIESYNILVIAPFPMIGQWLWMESFMANLLSRGHQITAITSFNSKHVNSNYTEIIMKSLKLQDHLPQKEIFDGRYLSDLQNIKLRWRIGLAMTENIFKTSKTMDLIANKDLQFDLVLIEQFYTEALYLFAHKFNCPIVTAASFGYTEYIDRSMGQFTPLSYVPHPILGYTEPMTFMQRNYNVFLSSFESFFRRFYYLPAQNKLAKKYFKDGIEGEIPHVIRMEKQISVQLINSHISTYPPRPKMPGQIDVAGAHIRDALAIPTDIQTFMDKSEHGVVFFTLGTFLRADDMPAEKFNQILEVLKNIKQNVLLKISGDVPKDLPPNVMARQWFPQRNIMAHPKLVLFITQGGIFSTQEALYHGVPMLFIPFFGEQYRNGLLAEKDGYASILTLRDLNEKTLMEKINKIVDDPRYKDQANIASAIFKDNPIHQMEKAMYWIEYAIRNNGAKYMKSHSVDMPWCRYLLLDVALFYFTLFISTVFFWIMIVKLIVRRYRAKEHKGKFKYY